MLAEYLKQNTRHQHDLLEEKFNSKKIFEKSYLLEDYKRLIALNYQFLLNYEEKINDAISDKFKAKIRQNLRSKLPLIKKDAELLGIDLKTNLELEKINSEAQAIGMLYVIEGASLGGNVIKKNLEKNPNFEGIDFHYFGMYNQAISEFWKEFILALNTYFPEEKYPEVLKGAERAYAELINYKI
ncbi:Heme oxygenase [Soonwooa buanensis]|uniref:Heme oxygenase n=1 Tax=Soonwooa buanensis TaxID=619805 RepID=A0A1T5DMW3_9FLAO|nr:biliverdin-producing heme oxygenase [Soonwooa buanensis]SKB73016.1 Heme oxygenase [Soonwooa buanensis]